MKSNTDGLDSRDRILLRKGRLGEITRVASAIATAASAAARHRNTVQHGLIEKMMNMHRTLGDVIEAVMLDEGKAS